MVRFFVDLLAELADMPRIPRNSLVNFWICSLINAACFSWLSVRSIRFMRLVDIQKASGNQEQRQEYFGKRDSHDNNDQERHNDKCSTVLCGLNSRQRVVERIHIR